MNRSTIAFTMLLCLWAVAWADDDAQTSQQATASAPAGHVPAVRTQDTSWHWASRKDAVKPDSGKLHHTFFVGEKVTFALGPSAKTYEVRDYWGKLVDQGPAGEQITVNVQQLGWYKLYVYGEVFAPWGDVVGGTTFSIFRKDGRFPELPPVGTKTYGGQLMRAVTGMGPQRHAANGDPRPGKPVKDAQGNEKPSPSGAERSIAGLQGAIDLDAMMYLPYDPVRQRKLMIAFPGGTRDNEEGVKMIARHYKDVVKYYEPRNEPNYRPGFAPKEEPWNGAKFLGMEMKAFYEAIKSVDKSLKVMGPGTVSIDPGGNGLIFIEDFLKAGGGQYIDAFSFHNYNMACGDLAMIHRSMGALKDLLKKYQLEDIELWQTEQGFPACIYGMYAPRVQGRWTMLEILAFEQYGLPKEQNHLWYDTSHGFWAVPHWWINDDGSMNPAGPLIRVYSEEVFGKTFAKALDFGPAGNNAYLGNLYTAKDGSAVAAFMTASMPDGNVQLKVAGADRLKVVSAFGVQSELKVADGRANLTVPELPVYVKLPAGASLEVVPMDFGPDLALLRGVKLTSSGSGYMPGRKPVQDGLDKDGKPAVPSDISKVANGQLDHWLWSQKQEDAYWYNDDEEFPAWIEIQLPRKLAVSRVHIYCPVPDRWWGTWLDYEVQVEQDGKWLTVDRVRKTPITLEVFTPPVRCTVDNFHDDQCIFWHQFKPVVTDKVRLLVHDVTFGSSPNAMANKVWQMNNHCMQLREVEIYGPHQN